MCGGHNEGIKGRSRLKEGSINLGAGGWRWRRGGLCPGEDRRSCAGYWSQVIVWDTMPTECSRWNMELFRVDMEYSESEEYSLNQYPGGMSSNERADTLTNQWISETISEEPLQYQLEKTI